MPADYSLDSPAASEGGDYGDLAYIDYADLLPALQKDLQLDASTDVQPGTVFKAVENDTDLTHGTIETPDKQTLLHNLGVGDAASIYLSATIASWGPGTGNPWASGGYTVGIDTGSRLVSGTYVCRYKGVYLVTAHVGFGLPGGGQFSLLFQNVTSGYCFEATDARNGGVAAVSGLSGATFIPASAGDVLQVQFNTTVNVSVQALGSTSHVGTWCNFMQVMAQ